MSRSVLQTLLLISFYVSLVSITTCFIPDNCQFTLKDSNNISSDYDLSEFYFSGKGDAKIHEVDDQMNPDFSYKFNICGSIPTNLFVSNSTIPSYCTGSDKGPCIKFTDYSNGTVVCDYLYPDTSTVIVPSAVQIVSSPKQQSCYWLGMELSNKYVNTTQFPNYKVDLVDQDNSGAGIIFTIMNGQFCSSGHNMNRELSVSLKCPDSTKTEWDADLASVINETVTESPVCVYRIEFETPLGCPSQCVSKKSSNSYAVCSTHGICVADPNAGHTRCICDEGYGGALCDTVISGVVVIDVGNHDLMTAMVICVTVTAICCGVAVYLWAIWRRSMKIHNILDTQQYFLGVDDDIEEDDDTLQAVMKQKRTRDTFHPVLTTDVETAKRIQIEHEKQSAESSEECEVQNDVNEPNEDAS